MSKGWRRRHRIDHLLESHGETASSGWYGRSSLEPARMPADRIVHPAGTRFPRRRAHRAGRRRPSLGRRRGAAGGRRCQTAEARVTFASGGPIGACSGDLGSSLISLRPRFVAPPGAACPPGAHCRNIAPLCSCTVGPRPHRRIRQWCRLSHGVAPDGAPAPCFGPRFADLRELVQISGNRGLQA